ncbi:hypothetical protein GQ457_01G015960 [Hibiscus cannabinus]
MRRRLGCSVFVNNVSKRIHQATLREAFQSYGVVLDVFISYWNARRKGKPTTFAFVRFKNFVEAKKAVVLGDRRLMDGFKIRVFMENNSVRKKANATRTLTKSIKIGSGLRDSKSFKDVVSGVRKPTIKISDQVDREEVGNFSADVAPENENGFIIIDEKSEGLFPRRSFFRRRLSRQSVSMVRSTNHHSLSQRRNSLPVLGDEGVLLQTWFDDLELLEGYEGKRRVKVWLKLEDVPLQVWDKKFFTELVNRWFDFARVLVFVRRVSVIPDSIAILVNGVCHKIRIKTEDFKEDRVFIDGESSFEMFREDEIDVSVPSPCLNDPQMVDVPEINLATSENIERRNLPLFDNDGSPSINEPQMFAAHSCSSSCGLHDVPIARGDGPPFITGFSTNRPGPGPVSSVLPTQEESISNASRLQEAPRVRDLEANAIGIITSKGGRNLVLRAGIDKCSLWMDMPKPFLPTLLNLESSHISAGLHDSRSLRMRMDVEACVIVSVRRVILSSKAKMVFLQETKINVLKPWLCRRLWSGNSGSLVVSTSEGAFGGLMTIWDKNFFRLESKIIKDRIILLIGFLCATNLRCGLLNVYAPNDPGERNKFLDSVTVFIENLHIPVLVGGDFNKVKSPEEKLGSGTNTQSMFVFKEFIQRNNFVDLPMYGSKFTWVKGGQSTSTSRLDRFLFIPEFLVSYPRLGQYSLPRGLSDHNPIFLREDCAEGGPMPFNVAKNCQGMGAARLLRAIKADIKVWVKDYRAKEDDTGERSIIWNEISRLRESLWAKFRRDEREWLQKDHRSISKLFVQHFSEGYNQNPTIPIVNFAGNFKSLFVTSTINLERPFTCEEVWVAISTADGSHAPGSDGFNLDFFKKFWPAVKHNVMDFFEKFHAGTLVDVSINHSFISLIPKVSTPEKVDDFRPISLVGSLYKILTRVLSRRLAGCLGEVISEHQFAFTAGKQLSDCALIVNEVIDFLSRNNCEAILFKADFKKVYDTVDWNFLDLVLQRMVFGQNWRPWVNMCISSASISVLINGVPFSMFNIKRGLRQGCPLSPLLFNLVAEALSVLICSAIDKGILKGVSIGEIGFPMSDIQFADDLILFLEGKFIFSPTKQASSLNPSRGETDLGDPNEELEALGR